MGSTSLGKISKTVLEAGREALRNVETAPARTVTAKPQSGMWPPPGWRQPSETLHEPLTIVLRWQVPPRNAAPRSWTGGLPMLLDPFVCPRTTNGE